MRPPFEITLTSGSWPSKQIGQLEKEGLYDGVLSNFAGLNCVADLRCVARDLARLVRPGGRAILCLFGRFCLWEMLWYILQGDIKKAFRRLRGKGVVANLAPGHSVLVRYPSVGSLRRDFAPHFRLVSWKGVGIAVPPSYLEPWAARFARLFKFAAKIDPCSANAPAFVPWRITSWWCSRGWRYERPNLEAQRHRGERSHGSRHSRASHPGDPAPQPLQLPVRDVRHLEDSAGSAKSRPRIWSRTWPACVNSRCGGWSFPAASL